MVSENTENDEFLGTAEPVSVTVFVFSVISVVKEVVSRR